MAQSLQLTMLSWSPSRPCYLLRWPTCTIMLDCAVDMNSLIHFMPFLYTQSERVKKLGTIFPSNSGMNFIKKISERAFIEGRPELHPVPLCSVAMDQVDAIIISNWQSLLALPYFTEGTSFKGRVYASEPTLQFGRLMMEELIEYFERVTLDTVGDVWKDPSVYNQFLNTPSRSPLEWKSMYDKTTMERSLDRVRVVAFTEQVVVDGLIKISSYSSGYTIGSCNWLITSDHERFGYIAASTSRTMHTRPIDWKELKQCDTLLLTSLSPLLENSPEKSCMDLIKTVSETLKNNGNVIIPMHPCGNMYDLLELLAKNIDTASDTPIYVISPVARKALAFANVYPEWLSQPYLDRVYLPEEPFVHYKFIENKRVKVYESLYGDFSRELRSPCVVFAGHPSLRLGDAPHLLEMWGDDARNVIIMTDPDFPPNEVYGPFEDLAIRAHFYPIDCRLDFSQLNPNVLKDLAPKVLIVPECYTRSVDGRPNSYVEYNPITSMKHEETVSLMTKSRKRKIIVHPDVASTLRPKGNASAAQFGLCSIRGILSCYDNEYRLMPAPSTAATATRPAFSGRLSAETLLKNLSKGGLTYKFHRDERNRAVINIERFKAVITLSVDGLHTNIRASKEHRAKLAEFVSASLVPV